jgi:phage recombination protein Bet
MNNQLAPVSQGTQLVSAAQQAAIKSALMNSLYPGASEASVDMVLAYCQAAGLDPMTKPVHIVPIWMPEKKDGNRVTQAAGMRDVVMPGIELYRTKAHRTREYAGQDDAEFGPTVKTKLGGADVNYPEWCKVTVYRLVDGQRVPYSARVYWLETYATAKRDTEAPNSMWRKRPFGQLEKCAEAAALRKAFPEAVGAQPTAEEMEGKSMIESTAVQIEQKPAYAERQLPPPDEAAPATEEHKPASESGEAASEGQVRMVRTTLERRNISEADLLAHFKIKIVEDLLMSQVNSAMDWIKGKSA